MKGVFVLCLLLVLCAPAVFASTAFIEPVNVSEGGSEPMNLTIGNHNNAEKVVGVELRTDQLEITDVTNLDEWEVDEDTFEIEWSGGELKTNVVAAIFPFRVSVPFVDKDTKTNITITLIKETTTEEFTLPIIIKDNPAFDKSEVTLLSPKTVRRGRDYTIRARVDPDHSLAVSAQFLGNTYTLNKKNNNYEKTITLRNNIEPGNYSLTLSVGADLKKTEKIELLRDIQFDINTAATILPGTAFKISGKVIPDDQRNYAGYQVTLNWDGQKTTLAVKQNQSFETKLIAPETSGNHTLKLEFNDNSRTFIESKKLFVGEPKQEAVVVEPVKENKTETTNLISGAIVAVEPDPKRTELKSQIQDIEPRKVSSIFAGNSFSKYLTNGYVWLGIAFALVLILAGVFMHDHRPSAQPQHPQPPQQPQPERREAKLPYSPENHPHRRHDDPADLFAEQKPKPKSNVKIISWNEHLKREQERMLNEGRKEE